MMLVSIPDHVCALPMNCILPNTIWPQALERGSSIVESVTAQAN